MLPAPGGAPKNWRVYRSRFIDPVRIAAGVRFWRANADHAGARPGGVRRAGGDHRRHHRRRDHLRPQHGQLPRHRCAGHPVLRLPGWPSARRRAHRLLPRANSRASCRPRAAPRRPAGAAGQLCRRHGHAAVHAQQHRQVRHRLRRRRAHRPGAQPRRRDRLGGQLFQGLWLAAGPAGDLSGRASTRRA